MGVTNRLVFDPTDADSIAASSSIGSYTRAGTDGELIDSTSNALHVHVASGSFSTDYSYAEDSAFTEADSGVHNMSVRQDSLATSTSADGDYASMKSNAKGEIYTIDSDGNALLTTIDADTGAILTDTNAMVVDLAAIEVEQLAQGTTLDSILTDTNAMVVDLAAIEVEQLAQGVTLDALLVDTTSIDGTLTGLSKAEDAAHASGDQGIMGLAVANHTEGALHSADGDYSALQVDSSGRLRVVTAVDIDDDLGDIAIQNTATAVSTSAVNVVASALAGRKWLYLANEGNKSLYFGKTGVTTVNGFPMHPGQQSEFRVGPAVAPQMIGGTGASSEDLRVMEIS